MTKRTVEIPPDAKSAEVVWHLWVRRPMEGVRSKVHASLVASAGARTIPFEQTEK
jgi:hypothetical protein